MPTIEELRKKGKIETNKAARPKMQRSGPDRPWQEAENEKVSTPKEVKLSDLDSSIAEEIELEDKAPSPDTRRDSKPDPVVEVSVKSETFAKHVDAKASTTHEQESRKGASHGLQHSNVHNLYKSEEDSHSKQPVISEEASFLLKLSLDLGESTAIRYLVLREISKHNGDRIDLSLNAIARTFQTTLATARRLIQSLEDQGLLIIVSEQDSRTQKNRIYRLSDRL